MTHKIRYFDTRDIRYIDNEKELDEKIKELKTLENSTLLSQTGECMTFGKEVKLIKDFFNNMNFDYLQKIKRIGEKSVNGFVNEMTFNKEGYKLSTVLKSSLNNTSDNLVYEYYIGSYFINLMIPYFPCFIETFNVYSYENNLLYNELQKKNAEQYVIDFAKTSLRNLDNNGSLQHCTFNKHLLLESYLNPTNMCLLIQHINNPETLYSFLSIPKSDPKWGLHLFYILLQIYLPLGKLMHKFTHNDLHSENVLLYKLKNHEYVEMEYHLEDNSIIKFRTQYIVKIIDYGRCYFKRDNNCSSQVFYDSLQDAVKDNIIYHTSSTNKKKQIIQVQDRGYSFFAELNHRHFYTSAYYGNISLDLLPLRGILRLKDPIKNLIRERYMNELLDLISNTIYDLPDNFDVGDLKKIVFQPSTTINVKSFSKELIDIFKTYHSGFDTTINGTKRGNMKIYMDMKKTMDVSFDIGVSNPIRKSIDEIEKLESKVYSRSNKHYVSPDLNSNEEYDDIFKNVSSLNSRRSKSKSNSKSKSTSKSKSRSKSKSKS